MTVKSVKFTYCGNFRAYGMSVLKPLTGNFDSLALRNGEVGKYEGQSILVLTLTT